MVQQNHKCISEIFSHNGGEKVKYINEGNFFLKDM